jgi:hypothetical protein
LTFSEFAKTLFLFCGDGRKTGEFVIALTDNIMEEPVTEADERKAADGEYNPLLALQPDALKRIYNGSRNISVKAASIIFGRLDKRKFDDFVFSASPDALMGLCAKLGEWGISANTQNVGAVCAGLFADILASLAHMEPKQAKDGFMNEFSADIAPDFPRVPQTEISKVFIRGGQIHIGGTSIKLPEKLLPPIEIDKIEMGYVPKLFEAYADAEQLNEITQETLPRYPKYQRNFKEQREHYYNAVYILERVRGVFAAEDGDQFDILKQETYDGISDVYADDYDDGFERLKAVLKHAGVIDVSKSLLSNIRNLIGISEKKGVCHILVSEGTIPSWVFVI